MRSSASRRRAGRLSFALAAPAYARPALVARTCRGGGPLHWRLEAARRRPWGYVARVAGVRGLNGAARRGAWGLVGRGLRSRTCGHVDSVVGSLPDPWQAERAGGGPVHGPSFCRWRRVVAALGSPLAGTAAPVLPALVRRKAWTWLYLRLLAPAAGRQAPARQPSANVRPAWHRAGTPPTSGVPVMSASHPECHSRCAPDAPASCALCGRPLCGAPLPRRRVQTAVSGRAAWARRRQVAPPLRQRHARPYGGINTAPLRPRSA